MSCVVELVLTSSRATICVNFKWSVFFLLHETTEEPGGRPSELMPVNDLSKAKEADKPLNYTKLRALCL